MGEDIMWTCVGRNPEMAALKEALKGVQNTSKYRYRIIRYINVEMITSELLCVLSSSETKVL